MFHAMRPSSEPGRGGRFGRFDQAVVRHALHSLAAVLAPPHRPVGHVAVRSLDPVLERLLGIGLGQNAKAIPNTEVRVGVR